MARTAEAEKRTDGAEEATGGEKRTRSRSRSRAKKTTTRANGSKRGQMSTEHKQALAVGRDQARTVNRYIVALDQHKPKRGRKVTLESLQERLGKVKEQITHADPGERLVLIAQEIELEERINSFGGGETVDLSELEEGFVQVAKAYAERRKIPREAFERMGVKREVLKRAGF